MRFVSQNILRPYTGTNVLIPKPLAYRRRFSPTRFSRRDLAHRFNSIFVTRWINAIPYENENGILIMAYTFDIFILSLIASSPLFLPIMARRGRSYRIIAGVTATLIGVFLIIAFWFSSLIDWEAHWLLANKLELVSLILLPISLVLFAIAPLLYIWLGIRFLTKTEQSQ